MTDLIDFTAEIWLWPGDSPWHFITLPVQAADDLRFADGMANGGMRRGFGSIKVHATIGDTVWQTSVFPDKKSASYLLPLKAVVRRAESLAVGDRVHVQLQVLVS